MGANVIPLPCRKPRLKRTRKAERINTLVYEIRILAADVAKVAEILTDRHAQLDALLMKPPK